MAGGFTFGNSLYVSAAWCCDAAILERRALSSDVDKGRIDFLSSMTRPQLIAKLRDGWYGMRSAEGLSDNLVRCILMAQARLSIRALEVYSAFGRRDYMASLYAFLESSMEDACVYRDSTPEEGLPTSMERRLQWLTTRVLLDAHAPVDGPSEAFCMPHDFQATLLRAEFDGCLEPAMYTVIIPILDHVYSNLVIHFLGRETLEECYPDISDDYDAIALAWEPPSTMTLRAYMRILGDVFAREPDAHDMRMFLVEQLEDKGCRVSISPE